MKTIKNWMKRHKWLSLIIIAILLTGIYFLRPKSPKPVPTQTVTRGELTQSLSITGTVSADKEANLTFPIGGTIAFLGVQKGDFVTQFQTIATLDQRTAVKNLQNSLISYSLQRDTFDQTKDNNQNRTPDQALNDAMKRILQDNQYNLDKAVVSVELQDLARQQSVLTTPIAGIVTRADAKTSGVTATATTTFTVTDPDLLSFKMEVDEADISKVVAGQRVNVVFDAYPEMTLHLSVDSIDFVTHTTSTGGNAFDVKATLPSNDALRYRVGMNGNAEIFLLRKFNALKVPLASLVEDNKIYVKTKKGFEKKTVRLGIQNDTSAEVVSGLSEGDVIATNPSLVPVKK